MSVSLLKKPGASLQTTPQSSADVSVARVSTASERDEFIQFQLELYRGDPLYVPPIVAERRDFLDSKVNPFLTHAELELFLARRQGRVVGRIAAILDTNYNQFQNLQVAFFGLFECVDDSTVAGALLSAAANWALRRGMKQLIGPANLSTNADCGLLVEGFDHPPAMMTPYNFRYYPSLLEANGFQKAKDLWAYEVSTSAAPPEHAVHLAEKLQRDEGISVRPLDFRRFAAEVRRIKAIYDAMLDRTWGFVPLTDDEFQHLVARLKPLVQLRPELCLIGETHGEPVAFSLTVLDSNIALKAAGGHLTRFGLPLGLARMAWSARRIDRLRVLFLGVVPEFRRRGIETLLYVETMRVARERGFSGGEIGWIPEDQEGLSRAIESLGARRYKTFRLYEREL